MTHAGTLTPAYGARYLTAELAKAAWRKGTDFIYHNPTSRYNGKYCSCRDFSPDEQLLLRYGQRNQEVVMVRGGKK